MAIGNLHNAKKAKNDEFYTLYEDIQKEVNAYIEYDENVFRGKTILLPCDDPEWSNFTKFFAQNFERFGLKKLISTSFAVESKNIDWDWQPTLFETENPLYDMDKTKIKGKIFTLTEDENKDGKINIDDLKWEYMEGTGDFRSEEVKKLRDEADVIITNPPFSLFKDFLSWIVEVDKMFLILGNVNAISYKENFPFIKEYKVWVGATNFNKGMYFQVPDNFVYADTYNFERIQNGVQVNRIPSVCWYTNIEHGKRHQPLELMTMEDNLKFNKDLLRRLRESNYNTDSYPKLDNYDAIDIPVYNAVPSDYYGIMSVPLTFLDKFCPEQFVILGSTQRGCHDEVPDTRKYDEYWEVKQNGEKTGSSGGKTNENANVVRNDGVHNYFINSEGRIVQSLFNRIFIQRKKQQ